MSAKLIFVGIFLGVILYGFMYGHNRAATHEVEEETEKLLGAKPAKTSTVSETDTAALPDGLTAKDACFMLRQKYKIDSAQSLGRASRSVRHHWKSLNCGAITMGEWMELMMSAQSSGHMEESGGTSLMGRKVGVLVNTHIASTHSANSLSSKNTTPKLGASGSADVKSEKSTEEECVRLMKGYHVEIGVSWGTLPASKQKLWASLECDDVMLELEAKKSSKGGSTSGVVKTLESVLKSADKVGAAAGSIFDAAAAAEEGEEQEVVVPKKLGKSKREKLLKGGLDVVDGGSSDQEQAASKVQHLQQEQQQQRVGPAVGSKAAGLFKTNTALPSVTADSVEWCTTMKKKHRVIPMKSWGGLPESAIAQWKERACDLVFTAARMGKKEVTSCDVSNIDKSLPLISVLAASTTRRIVNPSTSKLALFTYLLPSLIRTIDCGFRYEYTLGYDKGDPFYDSEEGMAQVEAWFEAHIRGPLEKNSIIISLRKVKVNNTLKKPGPVFLEMARSAYSGGADYMYRVNDDTEMLGNWPIAFVKALSSVEPKNLAVVGPTCNQGNQKILTHDFVARQHMEVFDMNYYPPELTDWWMDDWISFVYGKKRTFKAAQVKVIHHTGAHGQRYEVDKSHERMLGQLLQSGRQTIRKYMLRVKVDDRLLQAFDKDKFKTESFIHDSVPL
jgi:hypothetical protein